MSRAPGLCQVCGSLRLSSSSTAVLDAQQRWVGSSRRHSPFTISATSSQRKFSTTSPANMPRIGDHYGSLKLPKNATKQQIKAKFYELSKKAHPDAPGGSKDKFYEINEAYEVLGDETKRREYDLSLSQPQYTRTGPQPYHNPGPTYSPYSDPFNRRTGPSGAWSTRRPPPKAPPTGHGAYSPYGRHTPFGYNGASSGSYGDPFAHAREAFRQGFQDVKSGKPWPHTEAFTGTGTRKKGSKQGHTRNEAQGGDMGKIVGTFLLVIVVVLCGGSLTAHAESPVPQPPGWQELQLHEREKAVTRWGREIGTMGTDQDKKDQKIIGRDERDQQEPCG